VGLIARDARFTAAGGQRLAAGDDDAAIGHEGGGSEIEPGGDRAVVAKRGVELARAEESARLKRFEACEIGGETVNHGGLPWASDLSWMKKVIRGGSCVTSDSKLMDGHSMIQ